MNLPLPQHTQLLHKNAEVDCSVFTSLSSFIERLPSSTARSNIFYLGLPPDYEPEEMEVRKAVQYILTQNYGSLYVYHTYTCIVQDKNDVIIVKQEKSSTCSIPAKTMHGSSTSVRALAHCSPSPSYGSSSVPSTHGKCISSYENSVAFLMDFSRADCIHNEGHQQSYRRHVPVAW